MRLSPHIILSILMPLAFGGVAMSDEIDPFAPPAEEQRVPPKQFVTTGAFKVNPVESLISESIRQDDSPKKNPTNFNRHFDRPSSIWRVDGGYFGAFDGGEWGGALFFSTHDATKWTRIIDTHIQDLRRFEGDTFLASGGLAHLTLSGGAAYLITRLPSGQWQARMVFSSEVGIPRIVGTSETVDFQRSDSKKLIVLGLEHPLASKPFFGVDVTGAIHYLGERTDNKPSEQAGTGQPATPPELKSEGSDKPQPEAEGRSR